MHGQAAILVAAPLAVTAEMAEMVGLLIFLCIASVVW